MRILWMSNAPWAPTGYANQTRLFVPRLKALGHEMAIFAFYGLAGGMLHWNGMRVYPSGFHSYGQDVMTGHAQHFGADILLSLMDAWVFDPRNLQGVRWVPWFPIDHEPVPPPVLKSVRQSYAPIVYSRFAEQLAEAAGVQVHYVPHGVETKVFRPLPRHEARERLRLPQDRFIVGMVAANKGTPSRKAYPQQLEAFARFHRKHPDSLLYIHAHTCEHGELNGIDLPELVTHLGIAEAVRFVDPYLLMLGAPDGYMVNAFSAFDVLLSVSMGEGFCIPLIEAQACGTPVITGDWTSMAELCFAGWKVPKEDAEPYWTAIGAYQYLPRIEAIVEQLEAAYRASGSEQLRQQAREGALAYDADFVTQKYWKPVLEFIERRIELHKSVLAGAAA